MGSIIDYVREYADSDFSSRPLCEVDSLIFSQFAYLDFGALGLENGAPISELTASPNFKELFKSVYAAEKTEELVREAAESVRFGSVRVLFYEANTDAERQVQFCAVTFGLNAEQSYIAFRGTDASLVGWKEDFNLALAPDIPAQRAALDYVKRTAKQLSGRLYIGGHSKGGNLAVYASVVSLQDEPQLKSRIDCVFDHDGPGFMKTFFEAPQYAELSEKIKKTVPYSSIVGMLLENHSEYSVVKSSSLGIMQHDPLSWITSDGDFVRLESISASAKRLNKILNGWIDGLNGEQREKFVSALFEILESTAATEFPELVKNWRETVPVFVRATADLDDESKFYLRKTLIDLLKSASNEIKADIDSQKNQIKTKFDPNNAKISIEKRKKM